MEAALFFGASVLCCVWKQQYRKRDRGLREGHNRLLNEVNSFDPTLPIEKARTPPSSWYTSQSIFELEKNAVLLAEWQPVGRAGQLSNDGEYFSGSFLEFPYVVVLKGKKLRAFYNTCRHHAAKIVDTPASRAAPQSSGCISSFICPYHGWTYNLEGKLINAPKTAGCDLNFDENGLVPLHVATLGPFIFISFNTNPEPLESKWPEVFGRLNYSTLKFHSSKSYIVNCNWKVYVDNYLDGGYHVPVLHRGLTSQLDLSSYRTEVYGDYSIQSCGGKSERIGNEALYAWLFPGFMINRYGPVMDTNFVVPLTHDKTLVVFDFYFDFEDLASAEGKLPFISIIQSLVDSGSITQPSSLLLAVAFISESILTSEKVQYEDVIISESVQTGLNSPAYNTGR